MKLKALSVALPLALLCAAVASAQTAPADAPPAPEADASLPPAQAPGPIAKPGTVVEIEIAQMVTSKTAKVGDRFSIRLHAPVIVDGVTLIPAGVMGEGEVIDSEPAGMYGKPGKLILAARFLDFNGQKVTLRTLRFGGGGSDHTGVASGMMIAGGIVGAAGGVFIKGGDVTAMPGAVATAKLKDGYPVAPVAPAPEPQDQAATAESSKTETN